MSSDWVWEMDQDLKFSYFSAGFTRITGVPSEYSLGKTREELLAPSELKKEYWQKHLDDLANHREFRNLRYKFKAPNYADRYFEISGTPIIRDNVFQGYRGVATEITEREEARKAVRVANDEAQKANKAKSEFLSSMSHELRTPLNAIIGFAQLLLTSKRHPLVEKQVMQTQHILNGGEHLLSLIDEVLDLAKIESGNLSISIEATHPIVVLDECIAFSETLVPQKNITLETSYGSNVPSIEVDRLRFKQVVLNLISNAIKYNKDNGYVWVSCHVTDDNTVRTSIVDTGFGISEEKQDELFLPFNRLEA